MRDMVDEWKTQQPDSFDKASDKIPFGKAGKKKKKRPDGQGPEDMLVKPEPEYKDQV